jgi:hypothetical protein
MWLIWIEAFVLSEDAEARVQRLRQDEQTYWPLAFAFSDNSGRFGGPICMAAGITALSLYR